MFNMILSANVEYRGKSAHTYAIALLTNTHTDSGHAPDTGTHGMGTHTMHRRRSNKFQSVAMLQKYSEY